jgi:hypothetical protein
LQFDGINDWMQNQSFFLSGLSGLTIFSIQKFSFNSANQGTVYSYGQSVQYTNDILFGQGAPSSGNRFLQINNGADGSTYFNSSPPSDFVLSTNVFDGSQSINSDRVKMFENSLLKSITSTYTIPSTTGSPTTPTLAIGAYISFLGNWYLSGSIAEILIFPTALSDANRQAVEQYLNAKWAIY